MSQGKATRAPKLRERWLCTYCNWAGVADELLVAQNPFEPDEELVACPACREMDIARACDATSNCIRPATCGTPTQTGYQFLCGDHYRALMAPGINKEYWEWS